LANVVAAIVLAAVGVCAAWGVSSASAGEPTTTTTSTTQTTTVKTTTTTASPTITSIGPTSGGAGTPVMIRGIGIEQTTAVAFNGASASFTVSSQYVLATVPTGATTGPVTVTTPSGTATSSSNFIVTTPETDIASTYQIGVDHSGVQSDAALAPPLAARWVATLDGTPSYPVIAAGKVFVTTWSGVANSGPTLWALDQATGTVVWSHPLPGPFGFGAAAYDHGLVFAVDFEGQLAAFDAATGAQQWSLQLPGQSQSTSPPTAVNGVVYVGAAGSGGTLYAVDERTGAVLSTNTVWNGDHSSPAVSGGSVFVSYACNQAYGFATTTLQLLWHYTTSCEGGGGKTAVVANGRVYTRDSFGDLILDAVSGSLLGTYATAAAAPAVDQSTMFVLASGSTPTLTAQNLADGSTRWSFAGDGQLDTAPIVIATGAGEYVLAGSASGMLYALDAVTGNQTWSTNVGAKIPAPDEQNTPPLAGLGAGHGLVVVPAGNSLYAYAHVPGPTLSSFAPANGPIGTTVTITGSNLTGATAVRFNGTPAASFTVNSDTQITAVVASGSTSGPIAVTTPGGTGTSSGSFAISDFALSASPASRSVALGQGTSFAVTITPAGGFTGTVALSVTGLPSGATASFSPPSTTNGSTLTIQVSHAAKPGTTTLTVHGTSGPLSHPTTVTLQITKK